VKKKPFLNPDNPHNLIICFWFHGLPLECFMHIHRWLLTDRRPILYALLLVTCLQLLVLNLLPLDILQLPPGTLYHLVSATMTLLQGSHASWKVLEFFLKFPGPGKSWKMSLVLESSGIYLWFNLTNMPFMYITPCVNKCMKYSCYVLTKQFLCNFWWTFCNGLYCHTVYTE